MATLAIQSISRNAVTPAYAAATSGGDSFLPDGDTFLHVKNGSGGAITVTVNTPGNTLGLAIADLAVSVAAGTERMIGPFPAEYFAQTDDGLADITYSGVSSLTIGAFKVSKP